MVTLREKLRVCGELQQLITAAIEDEVKAQKEYAELADKTQNLLCGKECPTGRIANSEIMSIAADEGKHEMMLRDLLKEVDKECATSLGALFG